MSSPRRTSVHPEIPNSTAGGQQAAGSAQMRTVHFLDVENICGSGVPSKGAGKLWLTHAAFHPTTG